MTTERKDDAMSPLMIMAVFLVLLALVMAVVSYCDGRMRQRAVAALAHDMGARMRHADGAAEPVSIGKGWYRFGPSVTRGDILSWLSAEKAVNRSAVFAVTAGQGYGDRPDSRAVAQAAHDLGLTNGYFVHVSPRR